MSSLKQFASDAAIADERDSVGSSGPLDSNVYPAKIKLAYVTKADSGAVGVVINAATPDGRDIRSTLYISSGTAKGGLNYYTDRNGEKQYLPGFLLVQSLCLLATGKEMAELDTADKVVNIYNYDAKKELPTKVEMIEDLVGKDILIGLIRQIEDKSKKDANNVYQPTGETRETNEIDKFFRASDRKTTSEIRAQADATFIDTWAEKWVGKTRDRTSKVAGANGAPKAAGAPAGAAGTAKPKTSLFASAGAGA